MPRPKDQDQQSAREGLVHAAGEYYGVFPTRRSAKNLNRNLAGAVSAAKNTKPPISGEDIITILDDAKATGLDIESTRNQMVGRLLHPKDSQ